ncbi:amino acid permease 2 [Cordyceps fumosorosea ARSEF 2679]|uniref:Amino acid permease 2 n=1 Tax=Cordyceps fumosorosea (strain ARSEF 2679) TaxID=1081104 RepID=A0A167NCU7_CORFA|nr:amino acid permease 2 [Cordyceps fumosorosea ARSEF 2679]OAA55406.1 amino acid permease 2 [Cordyceps fumosorosea ARSEF 2679]
MGLFLVGTLIQDIIRLNNPSYVGQSWHGSLLVIAVSCGTVSINIWGSRIIPHTQNAIFALSLVAFVALIVPIWANAPLAESKDVWGHCEDKGGWGNLGLSVMVGQLPAIGAFLGIDTAAHMSEQVRHAGDAVPKVMMAVLCFNFVLTMNAMVTLGYHLPNVQEALDDEPKHPMIYVLMKSMSVPRDLFAFARDDGLPFFEWLSRVDQARKIPTNAYIFCGVYAITSLGAVSVLQCYCLSIGCLLWRRIFHPNTFLAARFSLGRWGVPVNLTAVLFSFWCFFWCFCPQANHPDAAGFNWSSPIFSAVIIAAMMYYFVVGRKRYVGPVALVEGGKKHFS